MRLSEAYQPQKEEGQEMKAKTAKEVLIATKWIINHIGWSKGTMYRDQKRRVLLCKDSKQHPEKVYSCCLIGAIELVNADSPILDEAKDIIMRATNGSIVSWNDTKGRTKSDVRAVLNKAIANAS